jgi:hypothetical protein
MNLKRKKIKFLRFLTFFLMKNNLFLADDAAALLLGLGSGFGAASGGGSGIGGLGTGGAGGTGGARGAGSGGSALGLAPARL